MNRDAFVTLVGVIAADLTFPRGVCRYETSMALVADRVESLARRCGLRVTRTAVENDARPWIVHHIVTVRGFRRQLSGVAR